MTIHALDNRFKVKSIPVVYTERPEGNESKLNTYRDGRKVLIKIFNMFKDYRPFSFFGIISVLLAIVGLVFFIPIFIFYLETNQVPIPTLVVSVFFLLAALLSLVCGLVLDTQVKRSKQSFEVQLNLLSMVSGIEDRLQNFGASPNREDGRE
jgi:ABC-type siderophore export system fused ATPase/permease subunit